MFTEGGSLPVTSAPPPMSEEVMGVFNCGRFFFFFLNIYKHAAADDDYDGVEGQL